MADEKIAILVDSCSDVPKEYRDRYKMYVVPLTIIYKDAEYRDGVDIQPEEVFARFSEEVPSTSLPSPAVVAEVFKRIKADGYDKVIAVIISSGLSGTFELISGFGPTPEGLEAFYVDTKNIGIGSGFSAIRAGELIEQGLPFDAVCREVESAARNTKLFFCVSTLEYLVKGGRIGRVSGMVGTVLDLKPVITCDEDGIYHTVAKARGRRKSLQLALDKAVEKLWFNGVTVVVASGNYAVGGAKSDVGYAPANDPFVITVGASDVNGTASRSDDFAAPWSAWGRTQDGFFKPEVAAPGRVMIGSVPTGANLLAQYPTRAVGSNLMWMSGTSFAAPVVSGIASSILAKNPTWTPDQVKGAIMQSATVPTSYPVAGALGVGVVNGSAAASAPGTRIKPKQGWRRRNCSTSTSIRSGRSRSKRHGTYTPK